MTIAQLLKLPEGKTLEFIRDLSSSGNLLKTMVAFFDDRIEIENPGILPPGITIEEMKQGISKIRNPVIARVFRELKLIEQWGSGVPRIFRETAAEGFPEPYLIELGLRVRFIFPLAKSLYINETTPSGAQSGGQCVGFISR